MLFSFIIPTWNYGHFLNDALNSILTQPGDDYEIIVVDDGSEDNTATIVKAYSDRYPSYVRYYHQKNQGPAAARNFGATQAMGTYLFMLDSDDKLLINALVIMREAIQEHPNTDLIIAQSITLTQNGKTKISALPSQVKTNCKKNFIAYVRQQLEFCHGAILKRHVMNRLQYPAGILGREDIVFFAQVLANHTAVIIHKPVVVVTKHADSIRHQLDKHFGAMTIADTLFNPAFIPNAMLKYKQEFIARLYLGFFRDCYKANNYAQARHWYWRAIKINPLSFFHWNYFSKLLRSFKFKQISLP